MARVVILKSQRRNLINKSPLTKQLLPPCLSSAVCENVSGLSRTMSGYSKKSQSKEAVKKHTQHQLLQNCDHIFDWTFYTFLAFQVISAQFALGDWHPIYLLNCGNRCFGISFYQRQTFQGGAADMVFSLWFECLPFVCFEWYQEE